MCFFQSDPVARDPEARSLPVGTVTTTESLPICILIFMLNH